MNQLQGFTLVELLVALSIIATLLGLLAPALMSARSAARSAVCLSGVRQLQLANDLFADDHQGHYVPGAANVLSNQHRWHGERDAASGPFDASRGAITPYLSGSGASQSVRACPEFAPTIDQLVERGVGFEAGCGGYGYNNAFVGVQREQAESNVWRVGLNGDHQPQDRLGADRARFAQPSRTIAFADAALPDDRAGGLIEYSFLEPRFWPEFPGFRPDPSMHFRHGHKVNIAWLDGHAGAMARSFAPETGYLSDDPGAFGLGWAGRSDDNQLYDYE